MRLISLIRLQLMALVTDMDSLQDLEMQKRRFNIGSLRDDEVDDDVTRDDEVDDDVTHEINRGGGTSSNTSSGTSSTANDPLRHSRQHQHHRVGGRLDAFDADDALMALTADLAAVLGPAACGKTTTMHKLAYRRLQKVLKNPLEPVPVRASAPFRCAC
jgi:flagellar biosynthesis GTPase FlhF